MGMVNNLAGAAGVVGLVGFEELAGMDTVSANASLRLSALAITFSGWLGFRSSGRHVPPHVWRWGLLAIPGAIAGAAMAVTLPVWVYRLTLLAVLLTVLAQQLRRARPAADPSAGRASAWVFVLLGAHMGFVQVASGLVAILALSAVHSRDLIRVNTAKMAILLCASLAANAVLAVSGHVEWGPALTLALGCGAGSFLASRWSVASGHSAVRVVVIVITLAVLARLLWQMADA